MTKDPIKSEFQNYLILDFADESTATNKNILVLFLAFRVKRNSKNSTHKNLVLQTSPHSQGSREWRKERAREQVGFAK